MATCSVPCGRMSCSTVSDVNVASSPLSCAWMSCPAWHILDATPRSRGYMLSPFACLTYPVGYESASLQQASLDELWVSLAQAFVTENLPVPEYKKKI